jgi:phage head maturation protease
MARVTTEIRQSVTPVTLRQTKPGGAGFILSGYCALFNTEALIAGMFRERIAPGAFADSLRADDIRICYNHDIDRVLGRVSAGTVRLREDARGLRYEATSILTIHLRCLWRQWCVVVT